jgi:hypothetical protein
VYNHTRIPPLLKTIGKSNCYCSFTQGLGCSSDRGPSVCGVMKQSHSRHPQDLVNPASRTLGFMPFPRIWDHSSLPVHTYMHTYIHSQQFLHGGQFSLSTKLRARPDLLIDPRQRWRDVEIRQLLLFVSVLAEAGLGSADWVALPTLVVLNNTCVKEP